VSKKSKAVESLSNGKPMANLFVTGTGLPYAVKGQGPCKEGRKRIDGKSGGKPRDTLLKDELGHFSGGGKKWSDESGQEGGGGLAENQIRGSTAGGMLGGESKRGEPRHQS